MKIIIAGAGKIGSSVAELLSKEGHDITVIDRNPHTISHLSNALDVICVEGSITNSQTLLDAGAAHADLLFASSRHDEVNMVCCISAAKLGTANVIARIRDPEYLSQAEFLRDVLGLNITVNPEYECAKEISRILRFPCAVRVDTFSKGSVEIIEHIVAAGSSLDGLCLRDLSHNFGAKVLIGLVERDGDAIIPNGDFTLRAGDRLSVTGASRELRRFFTAAGQYKKPVQSVMIMGGGRIAVYLSNLLEESGISVTIIEKEPSRCERLLELIPHVTVICGDATRSEVLLEEGVMNVDAFVALTGDDGDNIITSMYAKHCKVGKIVTKVNREHFLEILEGSGLDSFVAPKVIVARQLAGYVRAMNNSIGSEMETLHRLADGRAEALEFKVTADSRCLGIPLKQLKLRRGILITAVIRGNRSIIPDGDTVLCEGDHAVIVAAAGHIDSFDAIIESR